MASAPDFAPIALFAYKRQQHLARTLSALRANPEAEHSHVHVFSDGPRSDADAQGVQAVRALLKDTAGFKSVTIYAQPTNLGLARSITEGVSQILAKHDKVIVVEDDVFVAPTFLAFMNGALRMYEGDEQVASIHGYVYPVASTLPDTFFLRGADCWGWATWARAWKHFHADGSALLAELQARGLGHAFDLDGAYPYTKMLLDQIAGRNDSWAIRWHASAFLANMLTLYPGRSLVHNIGNDASGTHAGATDAFDVALDALPVRLERIPLREDAMARRVFADFLRETQPRPRGASGWGSKLRSLLQRG